MFSRRKFKIVAAILFPLLLLAACGGQAEQVEVTRIVEVDREVEVTRVVEGTPVTETVVEQVEVTRVVEVEAEPEETGRAGDLVWATESEPETLDHACTFSSIADIQYKTMFDTLVFWAPDQEFYPYLAESWEVSDDFTSYTFNLRQGVTFHDGTPFNAEAVKINLDRLVDPEACPDAQVAQGRLGGAYESAEVIDENTVRINFSSPNPIFLIGASGLYFTSPAAIEEFGEDIGRNPVGTGAFVFDEWVEQSNLTVVRNPDYNWAPESADHQGPAYLNSITWQFIPEASTRLASLEAGEAHLINRVEGDNYQLVTGNPDLEVKETAQPSMPHGWMLNASLPPLDDIRVRQAVGFALDRELMIETLFTENYQTMYGPITPAMWSYWPGVEAFLDFDPERAETLLEEAGWTDSDGDGIREKDGEPLVLTLMDLPSNPDRLVGWEFFQAQLLDVGIQLDLEFAEAGVVVEECHGGQRHICGLRWRMADPSELRSVFASENIGSGFNWTHLPDEQIDELLAAGASEPDREERREIYEDLQRRIMELAIFIPMWETQMVHASVDEFEGWELLPNPEYIWLYDAFFESE